MKIHPVRVSSAVACSLGAIVAQGLGQQAIASSEPPLMTVPPEETVIAEPEQLEAPIADIVAIAPPENNTLPSASQEMPPPLYDSQLPGMESSSRADYVAYDQVSTPEPGQGQPQLLSAISESSGFVTISPPDVDPSVKNVVPEQTAREDQQLPTPELTSSLPTNQLNTNEPQYYALNSQFTPEPPEVIRINTRENTIELPPSISPPRYALELDDDEDTKRFRAMLALANLPDFSPRLPLNLRVVTDKTITSDHPITDSAKTIEEWASRMRQCRNARTLLEHVQPDDKTTIPVVFVDAPDEKGPRVVRNANGNLVCIDS